MSTETRLFLDDTRHAYDDTWVTVRNYREFVDYVEAHGCPDVISFDHDLADEHYPESVEALIRPIDYTKFREKTGYDCAKWLEMWKLCPKVVIVHTMNPVGARNIAAVFRDRCRVIVQPYVVKGGRSVT